MVTNSVGDDVDEAAHPGEEAGSIAWILRVMFEIVLAVVFAACLVVSWQIESIDRYAPILACSVGLFFTATVLAKTLRWRMRKAAVPLSDLGFQSIADVDIRWAATDIALFGIVGVVAGLLLPWVYAVPATGVAFAAIWAGRGLARVRWIVAVSAFLACVMYVIFDQLVNVAWPSPVLGF